MKAEELLLNIYTKRCGKPSPGDLMTHIHPKICIDAMEEYADSRCRELAERMKDNANTKGKDIHDYWHPVMDEDSIQRTLDEFLKS